MAAEPLANIIEAQRIGQRHPITPRQSGMVCIEDLIEDPACNADAEKPVPM